VNGVTLEQHDVVEAAAPAGPLPLAPQTPIPLRELLALEVGNDSLSRSVHREQIAALLGLLPVSLVVNLVNALLVCWTVWTRVPHWQLAAWMLVLAAFAAARAVRISAAKQAPASYLRVVLLSAILAAIWLVPPLLWFPTLSHDRQLVIGMLLAGMMCGGSVTLAAVPLAAIVYIGVLAIGAVHLSDVLNSPPLILMSLVFAAALCLGALNSARIFIAHIKTQLELKDSGTMMTLLRSFDASGSDWLWELDEQLRIRYLSVDLVRAIGVPEDRLVGRSVFELLDPKDDIAELSSGMKALVTALRGAKLFRAIAFPVKDGTAWWTLSGMPLRDPAGRFTGWRGVGSDITQARLTGDDVVTAARHDPMTGLANRLLIRELLEEALLRRRTGKVGCALMLVDLDRFKLVNDTLGHEVGDHLLCEVARRLERLAPAQHVGRLGGDEFALVLTGRASRDALAALAEEIIVSLSAPYRIGVAELNIGATVGIAIAPEDGTGQEALTRSADLALYSAKNAERGSFLFFEEWMADEAAASRALENDLRSAFKNGEFSLAYQPIIDSGSYRIIAREALLRWTHPLRGVVPPDVFVPVIEDAGLIGQVGNWVLREACREAARWTDGARVAVNVSSAQLAAGPALVGHVLHALAASRLPAERLELELTESIFLAGDNTTRITLEQLRAIGVRLVLDDFGMGYSSFACLTAGHFNKLKIDRSFTLPAARSDKPAERAIVQSILTLAGGLDLEVTAEGIETPEQAAMMVALGCTQLQGFLFGRPELPQTLTGQEFVLAGQGRSRNHRPRAA